MSHSLLCPPSPLPLRTTQVWPFATKGAGIEGHDTLPPEQSQYSQEYWIGAAIRASPRYTPDLEEADFVFVDMQCHHSALQAFRHPAGAGGKGASPEGLLKGALAALQALPRFQASKGGDFGLVHPMPQLKGLFNEESLCEDLASTFAMVGRCWVGGWRRTLLGAPGGWLLGAPLLAERLSSLPPFPLPAPL